MRAWLRTLLVALLLLATALAAGLLAAGRIGGERVRASAERSLAATLGSPVRLASARLRVGRRGPAFEARGLEAFASARGPALRVERVSARIDPLSLMLGQAQLRRLVLTGAELRLERDSEGRFGPAALARALKRAGPDEPGRTVADRLRRAGNAARNLLKGPLPLLRASLAALEIEVRHARIVLADARSGMSLALEDLDGGLAQRGRSRALRVAASGRLVDAEGECGWITLEGARDAQAPPRLRLEVHHLDLRAIGPQLAVLHPQLRLSGVARGHAELLLDEGSDPQLDLDLTLRDAHLRIPRAGGGAPISWSGASATARVALQLAPRRLRLLEADLDLDGTRIRAEGVVERPLRPSARARLELRTRDVDLVAARDAAELLPDDWEERLAGPLELVSQGRVDRLELVGTATLAEWSQAFDPQAAGLAVAVTGTAHLEDVALRVGEGEPLEGLTGRVTLSGDRIEIRDTGSSRERPELDLVIEGLEHLLAHGHRDPRPRTGLPGLATLAELIRSVTSGEDDGPATRVGRGQLRVDWLSHPGVGFPLEDVQMVVRPGPAQGFSFDAGGRWGGLSARARGAYRPGGPAGPDPGATRSRVELRVEVDPPKATPPPNQSPEAFVIASLDFEGGQFQGIPLARTQAELQGHGKRIELREGWLELAAGGSIETRARLDLAEAGAIPTELDIVLRAADLAALSPVFGLKAGDLAGALDATAHAEGMFEPGRPLLGELVARATLEARNGEIRRRAPLAASLGGSQDEVERVEPNEPLPFRRARGTLALSDGVLETESLVLENDRVRIVAAGSVRISGEPHEVAAVIALFPHNAVDAIVGRVPIVGWILQGPDGRLIGRYLEVTGPWAAPRVERIQGRFVATGMIEGLPHFVMNGLRAIGSALARLNPIPQAESSEGS
jgi:hypothetical protein